MENYKKEIDDILHKAVTEKTFTLEIVEQIKELRKLPELVEQKDDQIASLNKLVQELTLDKNTLLNQKTNVEVKEKTLNEKERALELKEVEFRWKDNLLSEYKNMMSLVFRNQTIRQNKFGSVPIERNGYIESSSMTENTETIID